MIFIRHRITIAIIIRLLRPHTANQTAIQIITTTTTTTTAAIILDHLVADTFRHLRHQLIIIVEIKGSYLIKNHTK